MVHAWEAYTPVGSACHSRKLSYRLRLRMARLVKFCPVMENHSGRFVPFIVAAALAASCGNGSATFTGSVDVRALGVDRAVVIAESTAGELVVAPVLRDGRFALVVRAGETYRLAVARPDTRFYRIVSRVHVLTDAGYARYVEVTQAALLDLGVVRPIDWAALRQPVTGTLGVMSLPPTTALTEVEDPGTVGGVIVEDPGVCDEGSSESAGTNQVSGVRRQALAGGEVKLTICHVPPGDPANAFTVTVGFPAADEHLAHHDDYLGPCQVQTPPDPPDCVQQEGGGDGSSTPEASDGGTTVTPE
jgi:hypothetical protein